MSPNTVKEIRIFLGSPGDVYKERDIVENVVNELDRTIARRRDATVRLLRWETDTYPFFHLDGPQGAIDEQLSIIDCDIFLGIFWQRLGTPTKKANSGTEHEFWTAHDAWKKKGKPIIMLYRSKAPPEDLFKLDLDQIRRLQELLSHPKIKFESWIQEYKDLEEFQSKIRQHLTSVIQDILDGKITPPATQENQDDNEMLENLHFSKADWKPLTYNTLKKFYTNLSENDAIHFFDGREPSWKESISPSIARREIVTQLKNEITQRDVSYPYIVLLRGLGGEGKSTALQQTIYETVAENQHVYILWHEQTNTPLDLEIIDELAKTRHEWVIASDDAHEIENDLRKAAKRIRENDITNIRFLLATKDREWKASGADAFGWLKSADFRTIPISLTEKDSKMIVNKWAEYGDKGLGKLNNKSSEDAARELFRKARTEKKSIDNSLLGAMLQVRTGKTMQEHLKPSLSELEEIKAEGNISLRKAMAYISALHAYNIKIVTREILSGALGCSEEVLTEIIKELGKEIIAGKYILIRHASIAEAVKDILAEYYDFILITRKLIRSALTLFYQRDFITQEDIEEINIWNRLPRTIYFEKEDRQMGIELAQETIETRIDKDGKFNSYAVNNLAFLYEKSKQSEKAVKIYRENYLKTKVTRSYYYAWGVSEGKTNHSYISLWLTGISAADGIYEEKKDSHTVFLSLSGLSETFKFAYIKTKAPEFLNACYSSTKLALRTLKNNKTDLKLQTNLQFSEQEGAKSSDDDVKTLLEGVELAWSHYREDLKDTNKYGIFPEEVEPFTSLKFTALKNQFSNKKH